MASGGFVALLASLISGSVLSLEVSIRHLKRHDIIFPADRFLAYGADCVTLKGLHGTCASAVVCPGVVEDALLGYPQTVCHWIDDLPVVCCPHGWKVRPDLEASGRATLPPVTRWPDALTPPVTRPAVPATPPVEVLAPSTPPTLESEGVRSHFPMPNVKRLTTKKRETTFPTVGSDAKDVQSESDGGTDRPAAADIPPQAIPKEATECSTHRGSGPTGAELEKRLTDLRFQASCGLRAQASALRAAIYHHETTLPSPFSASGRPTYAWYTPSSRDGTPQIPPVLKTKRCGGILVHPRFVLTAARCFEITRNPASFSIRLGSNLEDLTEPEYQVDDIYVHPGYDAQHHHHDIALVRLSTKADLSETLATACLPVPGLLPDHLSNRSVTIPVWGEGHLGNVVPEGKVTVLPQASCKKAYETLGPYQGSFPCGLKDDLACAGGTRQDGTTCETTPGRPMLWRNSVGSWIVLGLQSFNVDCGRSFYPLVYTWVASHLSWITQHMTDSSQQPSLQP